MPVTIDELDAMVRAFYEGRGEQVLKAPRFFPLGSAMLSLCGDADKFLNQNSKKLLKLL